MGQGICRLAVRTSRITSSLACIDPRATAAPADELGLAWWWGRCLAGTVLFALAA